MNVEIVDFDVKRIKEAAKLLQNAQKRQFNEIDVTYAVAQEFCEEQILAELKKEISSSHLLMHDNDLVGYAIATITRDEVWGDCGWVNLAGWCIDPDFIQSFPYLYQKIADRWVTEGIYEHYFLAFDNDKAGLSHFCDMGFGKQQTHAVMGLGQSFNQQEGDSSLVYRKSIEDDQEQMNSFSHLIAKYQGQSPCFAIPPQQYLDALDEGFSDIASDDEIDLFVVEDNNKLTGYQGYYDTEEPGLVIPPKSVELAVSGVKEESRGRKCGLNLTMMGLSAQKERGFEYAVTDWRTTNLLSSVFWKKIGFIPVVHRLYRSIKGN